MSIRNAVGALYRIVILSSWIAPYHASGENLPPTTTFVAHSAMAQIYRRKYLLPSPDRPCTSIHHPPSDPVHIYRKYTAGPSPAVHAAHLLAGRLKHSYSEGSYHPLYPSIRCRIHLKHFQNFWQNRDSLHLRHHRQQSLFQDLEDHPQECAAEVQLS